MHIEVKAVSGLPDYTYSGYQLACNHGSFPDLSLGEREFRHLVFDTFAATASSVPELEFTHIMIECIGCVKHLQG